MCAQTTPDMRGTLWFDMYACRTMACRRRLWPCRSPYWQHTLPETPCLSSSPLGGPWWGPWCPWLNNSGKGGDSWTILYFFVRNWSSLLWAVVFVRPGSAKHGERNTGTSCLPLNVERKYFWVPFCTNTYNNASEFNHMFDLTLKLKSSFSWITKKPFNK